MKKPTRFPYRQVFAIPVLLAIVTGFGLLAALIGDNIFDVLSWATLAAPLAAIGWAMVRADRTRPAQMQARKAALRTGETLG